MLSSQFVLTLNIRPPPAFFFSLHVFCLGFFQATVLMICSHPSYVDQNVTEDLFLSYCVTTKYKEKIQILMRPPSLLQLLWPAHRGKDLLYHLLKMFGFCISISLDSNFNSNMKPPDNIC